MQFLPVHVLELLVHLPGLENSPIDNDVGTASKVNGRRLRTINPLPNPADSAALNTIL